MADLKRRIEEVTRLIDEVASGKGWRSAQRNALWKCKRMLQRVGNKLLDDPRNEDASASVANIVAHICELLQAYFRKDD